MEQLILYIGFVTTDLPVYPAEVLKLELDEYSDFGRNVHQVRPVILILLGGKKTNN